MKKIYTLIAVVGLGSGFSQAQNLIKSISHAPAKNIPVIHSMHASDAPASSNSTTVLWSDDFSVPSNWIMSHEAGSVGDWKIDTVGPTGTYAIPRVNSTTRTNGFATFDSDLICSQNQQAHITTASPINFSANPAVVLQFQQWYEDFYDSTFVQVSNDGVTWTKFDVNKNVAVNDFPSNSTNPVDTVTINISSVAGGQASVWIRFTFYSVAPEMGANAGCAYSWMVDDVQIMDAPNNDLKLEDVYSVEYSKIPVGQQMPITSSGYILNEGATAQTNVKLNVIASPGGYNQNSPAIPLAVAQEELFEVDSAFTPGAAGSYTITLKAVQDQVDEKPSNNTKVLTFQVTDTVFSRDNNMYSGGSYYGNGVNYEIGNIFEIASAGKVRSISFVIGSTSAVGLDVKAKLYEVTDFSGDPWVFEMVGESDLHTIVAGDKPAATAGLNPVAIRLPLNGGPINVEAGKMYLATFETSGASATTAVTFANGSNFNQPLGSTWVNVDAGAWGATDATPFVRLNMVPSTSGISNIETTAMVTILPNPSNGMVKLNCKGFDGKTSIKITNTNGQLIASMIESLNQNEVKQLDLTKLSKGLYFVHLTNNSKTAIQKIVIE